MINLINIDPYEATLIAIVLAFGLVLMIRR